MAKRNNDNSDYMSGKMDDELKQLEERITVVYKNAYNDVEKEFDKFTDTFKKEDILMQKKLEAGDITPAEYSLWRQKNILQTDRYKASLSHMTDILTKADITAMAVVNGEMPLVVAQSYNYVQSLGWKEADDSGLSVGTFQIYNAESVQKIIKDNPDLLKSVDIPEDEKWNKDHINREVTTSIIKGEPVTKTAERLRRVTDMDKNSAIRNARTSMTYAENLGRMESAEKLKDMGIPEDEVWSATYDNRTRETHLLLDGTKRDEKTGKFGEGILETPLRCPADPEGDAKEIYNCRCRLNIVLQGIDHSKDDDLYEQFMKENYPDDWAKLQASESEQAKRETAEQTKEYQSVLKEIQKEGYYEPNKASEASEESAKEITPKEAEEATESKLEAIQKDNLPASTIEIIGEKGEPISPETLAETVNPHFLEAGYTDNCQRCVVAYELGRRGYDVEAMAFDGSYLTTQSVFDISTQFRSGENFGTYITGEKYNPRFAQSEYPFNQSPKTTANSVVRAMEDWGEGSRATMEITWREGGGSHVVNVENIGGVVKIIDAQSGMVFDNIEGYLSRTKCAETELRRTDILTIRDNIPPEILERICKKRG